MITKNPGSPRGFDYARSRLLPVISFGTSMPIGANTDGADS